MLFTEVMCVLQVAEVQRQLQAATHEQQLCRQQLEAEQRNGVEVSSVEPAVLNLSILKQQC